jgi:hypothetical protein
MDALPRHGLCFGTLLLGSTATLMAPSDPRDLVHAAREQGSHLSAATDLDACVRTMTACGLLEEPSDGIVAPAPAMKTITAGAGEDVLSSIAVVFLAASPPPWLRVAVHGRRVSREYIPEEDLRALSWLEDELDQVLVEARRRLAQSRVDMDYRKRMGDVAEEVVMAALRHMRVRATQVSLISDAYGYDVEAFLGSHATRYEVKAAGPRTWHSFHLSRNEFDTSQLWPQSWRVVQVIFSAEAFAANEIRIEHVRAVRELDAARVREAVVDDTETFTWDESSTVTPPIDSWELSGLILDPAFVTAGFRTAG